MEITILASGSKGNSTLIELENTNILIDVGLPLSNLEKRLNRKMPPIDILIITHTHGDHIKGLESLLKKQKPEIYTVKSNLEEKTNYENIKYEKEIINKDFEINLFELSHDTPCIGISLKEQKTNKELIYITDTGYIKQKYIKKYQNKDIYIFESNYDDDMLTEGPYPFYLKQRIRSDKGHLSNKASSTYIEKLIGTKTKYICLAHLSEENNTKEKAKNQLLKQIENVNEEKIIICSQTEKIKLKI